jgi:hypothetical protein
LRGVLRQLDVLDAKRWGQIRPAAVGGVSDEPQTDATDWLTGTPMDPAATPPEPLPALPGFPFLHAGACAVIVGPTGHGRSSLVQAALYDAGLEDEGCAYLGSEVTRGEFDARAAILAELRGDHIDDGLRARLQQPDEPQDGGTPLEKTAVLRRLRKALKAASLDEAHRFRDLRHTFGTAMAAAGVPMRTLQEWMGHRDIQTTQRYADYAPRSRDAELVAAAFAPAERGVPVEVPI